MSGFPHGYIPLFKPSCSDLEVRYVTETLRSGWWGMGPRTALFEERFAQYVGASHAVAVNSGTAALQLACEALDVRGEGSRREVILPALTFVSSALAIMAAGGEPVFADVDEDTLCLDWDDVARKQDQWATGVMPVWYGGTVTPPPADLGVPVIEDCAHAAGSAGAGRTGVGCWSFHAVKNLATGDGGIITTDDSALADKLRALRWCGINRSTWERDQDRYGWDYDIPSPGHKMHMNDLTAALGLAQLERLDELNARRRRIAARYLELFADLSWLRLPAWSEHSSWHLFVVRTEDRKSFIDHMLDNGVSAGVHYKPLTYYDIVPWLQQTPPVTERVWQTLVTLPLYPDMTDQEFGQVVDSVRSFRPAA